MAKPLKKRPSGDDDNETRQFLALVEADRIGWAVALAAIRTRFAMRALFIVGTAAMMLVAWACDMQIDVAPVIRLLTKAG